MPARSIVGVATDLGIATSTLRRWIEGGLVDVDERRVPTARGTAQARVVLRLRERGYKLADIKRASARGSLASSHLEALTGEERVWTLGQAARETGVSRSMAQRLLASYGFGDGLTELTDQDVELLRVTARALEGGLPLIVVLQIARVYGQAISQIADAEVRLIHHHVHEPLMRAHLSGEEVVDQLQGMISEVLPLSAPLMQLVHSHYLRHFTEQDVIGHMEDLLDEGEDGPADRSGDDLARVRVAIAFADLAGYTRLTEELGDERAVDTVERFVARVVQSLPKEARVIKTIGDEAMIVSPDVGALAQWAVDFQRASRDHHPLPRIGLHSGQALYYEGDYYGREVNLASRVAARAAGGEVVVTRPIVDAAPRGIAFERIGEIGLKGFSSPTEILLARGVGDDA